MNNKIDRDFLFEEDCGFLNDENGISQRDNMFKSYTSDDGSEGYIYSDGSGYFHGADGYIYSDGSAYYHGVDGSDGYKYSDGSGYFHGADGSDAYKYTDGSGYYHGADGENIDFDSDGNRSEGYSPVYSENDSSLSLTDIAIGLGVGYGIFKIAKSLGHARENVINEEKRRIEEERIASENKALKNKRLKAFFFHRKKIEWNLAINDLLHQNVDYVTEQIRREGFNNFETIKTPDLYYDSVEEVGEVYKILIDSNDFVEYGTKIAYDSKIQIYFHVKREFEFPFTSREMINRNYNDIVNELTRIGYTNVSLIPLKDLTTGWIKKKDSIKQVLINGKLNVKKRGMLQYDTKITIEYHSFR